MVRSGITIERIMAVPRIGLSKVWRDACAGIACGHAQAIDVNAGEDGTTVSGKLLSSTQNNTWYACKVRWHGATVAEHACSCATSTDVICKHVVMLLIVAVIKETPRMARPSCIRDVGPTRLKTHSATTLKTLPAFQWSDVTDSFALDPKKHRGKALFVTETAFELKAVKKVFAPKAIAKRAEKAQKASKKLAQSGASKISSAIDNAGQKFDEKKKRKRNDDAADQDLGSDRPVGKKRRAAQGVVARNDDNSEDTTPCDVCGKRVCDTPGESWVQCDSCDRWLMLSCDPTIRTTRGKVMCAKCGERKAAAAQAKRRAARAPASSTQRKRTPTPRARLDL